MRQQKLHRGYLLVWHSGHLVLLWISRYSFFNVSFWYNWQSLSSGPMSERLFRRAWSEVAAESPVNLPWDRGCWPAVFGKHAHQTNRPLAFKRPLPPAVFCDPVQFSIEETAKKSRPQKETTSWTQIIRCVNEESWTELRDSQLQTALKRWLDVALLLPASCGLVIQLTQLRDTSEQLRMIRDLFHKKAPQTLLKRCHSFLHFVEHLKESGEVFPGTELGLYRYLCSLKDAGAPTSKVQSIVQALNFAQHVVGLTELAQLTSSKRCVGAGGVRNSGPKNRPALSAWRRS